MATKRNDRLFSTAALHWWTFYGHVHGALPDARTRAADYAAMHEIIYVQARGHEHLALRTIEAIVNAPVPGDSLAVRFTHFLAWLDARCPKKYRAPNAYALRQYREIVRGAA